MAGVCNKIPEATTRRESRSEEARMLTCQLPGDIVISILLRLPVKNLVKFKSVCKLWLTLISHPRFTRVRMKLFENEGKRVLLSTKPLQAIDFEAYSAGDGKAKFELDYPKAMKKAPEFGFGIKLVGSCNGLVCLLIDSDEFILWNPSTRESKELPKPPRYALDRYKLGFGFGYDVSSDSYKVLLLALPRYDDGDNASTATNAEVLKLKSNSWIRIQDFQSGLKLDGCGIFMYGHLHWLGRRAIAANQRSHVIVSFDVKIEKFHKAVQIPDHVVKTASYANLGVSGNCLCLFCKCSLSCYEGWIMKENDIKSSSWTRLFSVEADRMPNFRNWKRELCYTKTGKVLIDYDGMELVIYDPTHGTSQFLTVMDWGHWFHSIIYNESPVCPVRVKF